MTNSHIFAIFYQGQGFQDIANIRKYGKVFKLLVARDEVVVVADTEILKHVLVKDFTDFTDRKVNIIKIYKFVYRITETVFLKMNNSVLQYYYAFCT